MFTSWHFGSSVTASSPITSQLLQSKNAREAIRLKGIQRDVAVFLCCRCRRHRRFFFFFFVFPAAAGTAAAAVGACHDRRVTTIGYAFIKIIKCAMTWQLQGTNNTGPLGRVERNNNYPSDTSQVATPPPHHLRRVHFIGLGWRARKFALFSLYDPPTPTTTNEDVLRTNYGRRSGCPATG